MERLDAFTIRVYGILIHNNQLMRLKEPFWGEILYKMPGGGLEFGEGTLQCLARELKEELNLTLDQAELFMCKKISFVLNLKPMSNFLLCIIKFLAKI